jgi:hypothetical protein
LFAEIVGGVETLPDGESLDFPYFFEHLSFSDGVVQLEAELV